VRGVVKTDAGESESWKAAGWSKMRASLTLTASGCA
jgi:hypothetical protein